MRALKIIAYMVAAGLFIFGLLFILGSGGEGGSSSWVFTGIILIAVAFGAVFLGTRIKQPGEQNNNVTVKIDMPGNVSMDTLKCKSCGGTLSPKDVTLVAGAPVVTCPYCNTTYQLTEEPKW